MAKPTLLLLPGLLCDDALWALTLRTPMRGTPALGQATADRLADAADCIIADLTRDDRLEAMAARALATLPPRFSVAGLSMGGYAAFALLRLAPERVASLVLLDTTARPDSPSQARRRRALIALARDERQAVRFRGVTLRLLPSLIHPDRLDEPDLAGTILTMAERVGRAAYLRQQTAILHRPDSRPMLARLDLPVHVVVGDSDQVTPPDCAHEIAALLPRARLTILPRCGHLAPLERPDEVATVLRQSLSASR
jgi:pimeloyl-ACP methyl ester carboxylesterase